MNNECIFCRIVAGELPSVQIYSDDVVMAFMDINPVQKGHALVIPRDHYDPITETPDDILAAMIKTAKAVAAAQIEALGAVGINVTQANGAAAGQIVPHIHIHVIPRCPNATNPANWLPSAYRDNAEMQDYGTLLREALSSKRAFTNDG